MNKKGFVTQQFNWIFVLLAGAIILILFIQIANVIQKTEQAKLAVETVEQLDAKFTAASVNEDTIFTITISNPVDLFFSCTIQGQTTNQDTTSQVASFSTSSQYGIENPTMTASADNLYIFSPQSMRASKYMIAVKPFTAPFRVDRMLYIASDTTQIIFISEDRSEFEHIARLIPANITFMHRTNFQDYIQNADTGAQNHIVVTKTPPNTNQLASNGLRNIARRTNIKFVIVNDQTNFVQIRQYNPNSAQNSNNGANSFLRPARFTSLPYFSDETLLGAIYAHDSESYGCVLQRLQERWHTVARLHIQRLQAIQDAPTTSVLCKGLYGQAIEQLNSIQNISLVTQSAQMVERFFTTTQSIERIRSNLEVNSCPDFY